MLTGAVDNSAAQGQTAATAYLKSKQLPLLPLPWQSSSGLVVLFVNRITYSDLMRSIRHGNNRRKHLGVSLPAGKLNKHKCPHSGSSRKGAARARRPVWTGVKDCHLNQCMALPVPTSCRAVINLRPLIWRRIDFKCAAVCDVELGRVVQVRSARGACAPGPTRTKRSCKSLQQSRPASEPANLSGENTPNAGVISSISLCARAQFNTPITHPRLHPPDYQCTCGSHKQAKSVCHRGPSCYLYVVIPPNMAGWRRKNCAKIVSDNELFACVFIVQLKGLWERCDVHNNWFCGRLRDKESWEMHWSTEVDSHSCLILTSLQWIWLSMRKA